MSTGLNVGRLINVAVNLAPSAAARANLGVLMIAGDSDVIDTSERLRSYTDLESIGDDFGVNAPEYAAAALYYAQLPKPLDCMIGRWVRTATSGLLRGTALTTAQQVITLWTAIRNGAFKVSVDGVSAVGISTLDFHDCTTLNGVAAVITEAIGHDSAVCTWTGTAFKIVSATPGALSSIGYLTAPASPVAPATATDIGTMLKLTAATAASKVDGIAGETPAAAVTALANVTNVWRGLMFAASTMPSTAQNLVVATAIEAMSVNRIFGITDSDTQTMDATHTSDTASVLKAAVFNRSMVQYSQTDHAVASLFGRAFSVDYSQPNACITLMYKQEPGVTAEVLTETQAAALEGKNCNVFVAYDNDTSIIQEGKCASGVYLDEMLGLDWFTNAMQTSLYNALYTATTKIPQTDDGQNQLAAVVAGVCGEAVNNRLLGPGTWNADGFGQLKRGDFLDGGFYIYSTPMAQQSQDNREQRLAPPIKVAAKFAGAIHKINATIDVNR